MFYLSRGSSLVWSFEGRWTSWAAYTQQTT